MKVKLSGSGRTSNPTQIQVMRSNGFLRALPYFTTKDTQKPIHPLIYEIRAAIIGLFRGRIIIHRKHVNI